MHTTFQEVKKYKEIVKFLIARLIYNDGLVTIFAFGGIYAAGTFGMSFKEIMLFRNRDQHRRRHRCAGHGIS